jgi:hypothetical protein
VPAVGTSAKSMLKIHEATTDTGELSALFLRSSEAGELELVGDDGALALPANALEAVMSRFGAPFDAAATISVVATLLLDAGRQLRHVRHLAGYDVIARDYLVYERPQQETLCALATTVAAALSHLGRAKAARAVADPSAAR